MRPGRLAILILSVSFTLACASPWLARRPHIHAFALEERTFVSIGEQDGYVVERWGVVDVGSTGLRVGDENGYAPTPQVVSILSFDTSPLPDEAEINSVKLILTQESSIIGGGNPFVRFDGLLIDVKRGAFGSPALEFGDYDAPADAGPFGPYMPDLAQAYTFTLGASSYGAINRWRIPNGLTQLRLRFSLKSDGNDRPDYIHFYSGDEPTKEWRPQLLIQYHLPTPIQLASNR